MLYFSLQFYFNTGFPTYFVRHLRFTSFHLSHSFGLIYPISMIFESVGSIPYTMPCLFSHWNINFTEDQDTSHRSLQTDNISICLEAKDEFPHCLINRAIAVSPMDEDKAILSVFISNHFIWLDLICFREFYCLTTHNTKNIFHSIDSQFPHH